MKKVFSFIIAVLLCVTMFTGLGVQKSEAKTADKLTGSITFQINNGQKVKDLQQDAAAFMKANPGTKIEIEFIDKPETLQARLAANDLPDISQVPDTVVPSDWPSYYIPLDGLGFTKSTINFYDKGVVNGKLYTITQMASFNGIVYNKKVFKKAGITKIPRTVSEFYSACAKLKAAGVVPFATNFKDKWPLGMYLLGPAGAALSGDANYNNKLVDQNDLFSNVNVTMLNFLKSLKDKGYVEPDLMSTNWGGFIKDMGAGKFGMTYLGSWFPPQTSSVNDIGMFPFPGSKGVPIGEDLRYGIAKTSKSPELAKAYFQHLFKDGALYPIMGFVTPLKGVKYNQAFVKELTSYGVPNVEMIPESQALIEIKNAMAVDPTDIVQEYMLSKDTKSVISKYNAKWVDAKKSTGR